MTMSALRLRPRNLRPTTACIPRSPCEGGVPETWTGRPPVPMPSAFSPSTPCGRSWTVGLVPKRLCHPELSEGSMWRRHGPLAALGMTWCGDNGSNVRRLVPPLRHRDQAAVVDDDAVGGHQLAEAIAQAVARLGTQLVG